jgi:hypothetical protein
MNTAMISLAGFESKKFRLPFDTYRPGFPVSCTTWCLMTLYRGVGGSVLEFRRTPVPLPSSVSRTRSIVGCIATGRPIMPLYCWRQPKSGRRGTERSVQVQSTIFCKRCNDSSHHSSDSLHPTWILLLCAKLLRSDQSYLCRRFDLAVNYVVCLKSSVNGTVKQTKQKIQTN